MRLLRFLVVLAIPLVASILACGSEDSPAQNPAAPQNPGAQNPNNPQNPQGGQGVGAAGPNDPRIRDPQIPPLGIPNQDNDGNNNAGNRPVWNVPANPGQIPGGGIREGVDVQIPVALGEGSQNNSGAAARFPIGGRLPSPGQLPGNGSVGDRIQPINPEEVGEAIRAQQEARRNQLIASVSVPDTYENDEVFGLMGDTNSNVSVVNTASMDPQVSYHTVDYLSLAAAGNGRDIARNLMAFHRSQLVLRVENIAPNRRAYVGCSRVAPVQDFDQARTKCQINNFLDANAGLARPELRQFEWTPDLFDGLLDDQKNFTGVARKTNANDRFLQVLTYNYATQQTSSQFLAEQGAPLNFAQDVHAIEGPFDFSDLRRVQIAREDGWFYLVTYGDGGDRTGRLAHASLYKCGEQNGRIGVCVRKDILRNGALVGEAGGAPQLFYRGTQFRFEQEAGRAGSLVFMESLFYREGNRKEILLHEHSLSRFLDAPFINRFSYEADTQYNFLTWVRHSQDMRDFFVCGFRQIRGGSAVQQLDVMKLSYAGNGPRIHERTQNLLRLIAWAEDFYYLSAALSPRGEGPSLYLVYPFGADLDFDLLDGTPEVTTNFIRQYKQAHARTPNKLLKVQFSEFENL